jgi:transcriptional regulator with XRE-family HTH domain
LLGLSLLGMSSSDDKPPRLGPEPAGNGFAFARPEPGATPPEALIGERIKALRKELGLTQIEFAAAVETTQSAISKWERRDETPSDVFVERMAQLTGTTAGYIRYGEAYQRRQVPIIGYVGAGAEIFPVESGAERIDGLTVPSLLPYDAVALIVRGNVLLPEVDENTVLVYRRDMPFDESSSLTKRCIVALKNGPWLVKRLMRGSAYGRYTLLSTNAPPLTDVEIAWAAPILAYIPR